MKPFILPAPNVNRPLIAGQGANCGYTPAMSHADTHAREAGPTGIRERITEFHRIGPVGVERRALTAATIGLPDDPAELAALVPAEDLDRLAAALVRSSLSRS